MTLTKSFLVVGTVLVTAGSATCFGSGDPVKGAEKAVVCIGCHGNNVVPGLFPLVQLAGRDADKLVIKTNKYHSWKLISPVMNMVVAPLTEQDIEDIAAYYQSLGKPVWPLPGIKGDEDLQAGK